MNLNRINPWIAGLCMTFFGTLLIYLEDYRNNQLISGVSYFLVVLGWITLFIRATKNTAIDEEKVLFSDDKKNWIRQRATILFMYCTLVAIIFGNIYFISSQAQIRKANILENSSTKTTIAIITRIESRRSRSTTSYYAIFHYNIGDKLIEHPRHENEGDFFEGEQYEIKYSVEYPEMFLIIRRLPQKAF